MQGNRRHFANYDIVFAKVGLRFQTSLKEVRQRNPPKPFGGIVFRVLNSLSSGSCVKSETAGMSNPSIKEDIKGQRQHPGYRHPSVLLLPANNGRHNAKSSDCRFVETAYTKLLVL